MWSPLPRITRYEYLVIHHSDSHDTERPDAQSYRDWHLSKGWFDIGYHGVFEVVGDRPELVSGRPLHLQGSHCKGFNRVSLGACLAGDFEEEAPSQGLLEFAAGHLAGWCQLAGIPIDRDHIKGHGELGSTKCPGSLLDLDNLVARIQDASR